MAWVELTANGSSNSVEAVTRLIGLAQRRGFAFQAEDETLTSGSGPIKVEFPDIEDEASARAAAQALILDVPGGDAVFTIA